jgi:hypothetical protein
LKLVKIVEVFTISNSFNSRHRFNYTIID